MAEMKLKEPLEINGLELRNRLVMPPMATERSSGGRVTDSLVAYYSEMTRGGYLGLVEQEHSYISPEGRASPNQVSIADDGCIEQLRRIVDAVHANGIPIFAQLNHAGSATDPSIATGGMLCVSPVPPSRNPFQRSVQAPPKVMEQEDIDRIVGCFADAAERAKKAGYDGVEIHSAHGYLLDQFYSPLSNHRTDAYTGSTLEGRVRIHTEVLRAVRGRVGDDYPVSVRLGASDYMQGGAELSEVPFAASSLAEAGADMISISGGMCGYKRPGYREQGWFAELSHAAKEATGIPVLLTGGIVERRVAERLLEDGDADLIGVGRALLRDHGLPGRWMSE